MPIPFTDPGNPQTLNAYAYVANNPLTNTDTDGHDVSICLAGATEITSACQTLSNPQYQAAQQGNNGGLSVPTLDQVLAQMARAISESDGNAVGTAIYSSNGGADYYGNQTGYNLLGITGATVGSVKGIGAFYGLSAVGAVAGYAGGLTALGGVEANSVLGPSALRTLLSQARDAGLRNLIKDLYRVTATVGDGGTADAISYTKEAGELVGGSDHIMKGQQYAQALQRVLNSGRLDNIDQSIAQQLLNDLQNALK